jgi:biopolymer transport protein ExbD
MAKVKPKRMVPTIDMTAMVDVAFLLLTFFILTTTFRPDEEPVDTPSSSMPVEIPKDKCMFITVTKGGQVFVGFGEPEIRAMVLEKIIQRRGLPPISEDGKYFFSLQQSYGVPVSELNNWLKGDPRDMIKYAQKGVPVGLKGTRNELLDWVWAARSSSDDLYYAIRGDVNAEYPEVKAIFATLQEYKINRFNLLTSLEKGPGVPEAATDEEAPADKKTP